MAGQKVDNISAEVFRWAFQRAGFVEEQAIEAFPLLGDWLSKKKVPTMNGLERFAKKWRRLKVPWMI